MTDIRSSAIQKSCCFTGHRDIEKGALPSLQKRLQEEIRRLIEEKGVCNFIAGGALGFDTLAAEAVLALKEKYPSIRLLLALPCPEQTARWKEEDVLRYQRILAACDKIAFKLVKIY